MDAVRSNVVAVLAAFTVVAGMIVVPASAGGLPGGLGDTLGGVVDTVGDVVGGLGGAGGSGAGGGRTSVGGLVSVNDDDDGALVNLDVGGDDNILSTSVGGLVGAEVSTNRLSLDLAGLGVDLDLDLAIPSNDGSGGPGGPAGPGGRPVLVGSLGDGHAFVINCTVNNTRQLLQVASAGKVSRAEIKAWMRAANVQVVPIKLCLAAKKQVAALLAKSKKINLLRRATMADALITASLGRTRYDAGDVVAVQRKGAQLVVYMY